MASQIQDTQCTQGVTESDHRTNVALSDDDIADVVCILHPCSPAAFGVAVCTAEVSPQHILQSPFETFDSQGTLCLDSQGATNRHSDLDLALRFSSNVIRPAQGFVFGRNPKLCDVVLSSSHFKRVSNVHFRIFVNSAGVCMIEDMSTNGTLVDDFILKGKGLSVPQTRMLNAGSVVQILSTNADEALKFIVRIPSRQGHIDAYTKRFQDYIIRVREAQELDSTRDHTPRPDTRPGQPYFHNQAGMHWDGGPKYNCIDLLGKGAFASVYRLANKTDGQLFAAKELDKRKFVKNGGMNDSKLNNEMRIMERINHPNIVQFIEYHEHNPYLYIIMEYVPFGDLQQFLSSNGTMSESLGRTMAQQVFHATSYLHSQNITHRDIKPDNILIADASPASFTVKLSDFGLSKVVKDNDTFLKTFCGTLLYCAPEVFPHYGSWAAENITKTKDRDQQHRYREYSQSVDVWSFGAVLWYSVVGLPPYEGVIDNTGRGMFERIMTEALDTRPLIESGISESAVDLMLSTLRTDPVLRPTALQCLSHPWFDLTEQPACDDMSQLKLQELSDPFSIDSFRPKRRRLTSPGTSAACLESVNMQMSLARSDSGHCDGSMRPFASSGVLVPVTAPQSPGRSSPLTVLPQNVVASINPLMGSTTDDHVFAKPLPRLGQLITTPDSFIQLTLNLNSRKTSWGRGPKNTIRFPEEQNTQIPKRGLILVFYAAGILEAEAAGTDWTGMAGLHCLLATESTFGVSVNGQVLRARDEQGRGICCRLYTGDVIRINSADQGLSFRCEFSHGEASKLRKDKAKIEFMVFEKDNALGDD